jgi:hypothetical protein
LRPLLIPASTSTSTWSAKRTSSSSRKFSHCHFAAAARGCRRARADAGSGGFVADVEPVAETLDDGLRPGRPVLDYDHLDVAPGLIGHTRQRLLERGVATDGPDEDRHEGRLARRRLAPGMEDDERTVSSLFEVPAREQRREIARGSHARSGEIGPIGQEPQSALIRPARRRKLLRREHFAGEQRKALSLVRSHRIARRHRLVSTPRAPGRLYFARDAERSARGLDAGEITDLEEVGRARQPRPPRSDLERQFT